MDEDLKLLIRVVDVADCVECKYLDECNETGKDLCMLAIYNINRRLKSIE